MSNNAADFSKEQKLFVAGTLIGIRSWKIDQHARLTGVSFEDVWLPTENTAICHANRDSIQAKPSPPAKIAVPDNKTARWEYSLTPPYVGIKVALTNRPAPQHPNTPRAFYQVYDPVGAIAYQGARPPADITDMIAKLQAQAPQSILNSRGAVTFSGQIDKPIDPNAPAADTTAPTEPEVDPNAPKVADLECQCGYYAYFDTHSNPHHRDGMISGIIEAWGTCTVGERGFRASKAQIKGLIMPPDHPLSWERIRDNYPDIPLFDYPYLAIRAFPLTNQNPLPNPADTPDFWTM